METITKLRARLGGLTRASRYDGLEVTAKARETYRKSFEDLVDPERKLPEAERLRRAEAARKAHFTRLALASVKARSKKNAAASTSAAFSEEVSGGTRTTSAAV